MAVLESPAPATPRGATPPGPKGRWFRGNVDDFRAGQLDYLTDCHRRYGDIFAIRLGPRRIWVLNHPDLVEEVLVTRNRHFQKHFALRSAKTSLGDGLLTSEGDFWRRQRKMAQPAFHRDRVASYGRVMVEYAERMLDGWADGQPRDAQADMMALTLEIVVKTLFDADVAGESTDVALAMEILMESFSDRVGRLAPLPVWVPVPSNLRFRRAMRRVEAILMGLIADRRRSGDDRGDLLSMLLHAQAEGGGAGMTDRQLRDEAVTLFMAGHETTANTLAWIWLLLSRNPDAEAKLHAELDEVLDGGRPPEVSDLPRLRYTEQVVSESLRVLPTVWLLGRDAIEPVNIGGYDVPRGVTLWMSQWVIHRDPRWFDDPEAFRPERWADGLAKRLHRYAYFPFGGGPRICIGDQFAKMEAVLLLATIARRFRPRVAPGTVVTPVPTMTLRPERGLPVVLEARRRGV